MRKIRLQELLPAQFPPSGEHGKAVDARMLILIVATTQLSALWTGLASLGAVGLIAVAASMIASLLLLYVLHLHGEIVRLKNHPSIRDGGLPPPGPTQDKSDLFTALRNQTHGDQVPNEGAARNGLR